MGNNTRRKPFPQYDRISRPAIKESYIADEAIGGVFGFFRDFGTRETIESIIIAVILALMFRAFEAEAFIIPTGSMAPSLQGQHKDLACENCGYRYRSGASQETGFTRTRSPDLVTSTFCPICQFENKIRPNVADHTTNNGDRILVNKFIYDFSEPQRYDVIVFKNPNNGKQNYIKRLIGLPGDNILIENGDIFLMTKDANQKWSRQISRKPPHKLRHVLQTVDDTDFIGAKLKAVDWPLRWQEFAGGKNWDRVDTNGNPGYVSQPSDQPGWLRYRHFRPFKSEWPTISDGELPARFRQPTLPQGRLIGDQYAYNDEIDKSDELGMTAEYIAFGAPRAAAEFKDLGLHWVGDIGLECWTDVSSATGKLLLDVVEGGAHFICEIDVATGVAILKCDEPSIHFQLANGEEVSQPTATTNLQGPGKYHIEYVNADDRIHLWINGKLATFDAAEYQRDGIAIPKFSPQDPGDAEPLGVAAQNLNVRISRLKVVRDIYYTAVRGEENSMYIANETEERDVEFILNLQQNPSKWSSERAINFFKKKKGIDKPMFFLKTGQSLGKTRDQDQFLPMGDNSPQSSDGRIWEPPNYYFERNLLIGRALFIYWPHTLNEPIPYFPNFGKMGFIR